MYEVPDRLVELGASALTGNVYYIQPGDGGVAGTMNRISAMRVLEPVLADLRQQINDRLWQHGVEGAWNSALEAVLDLLDGRGGSDE